MAATTRVSNIRGAGAVFCQFKNECAAMINYVQNLLQKGKDVMLSLEQDNDTQVTSIHINFARIAKLHSLLNRMQMINNFALILCDDETEHFLSHVVNPTISESSRATVNPTFNDDPRADIISAYDISSSAVVNPSLEACSVVPSNVEVDDDMIYLSDDETEHSISHAVNPTIFESSIATVNPELNDDPRADIISAYDISSSAVVNPSLEECSVVPSNVEVDDMIYLSDDETEHSISHAVNPTIFESSRATVNPELIDDPRADIISAYDVPSNFVVNPSFEECSMIPCNVKVGDILDMVYLSGNNPYEFWLRYYSTKTLDKVIQILTTRCKMGKSRQCIKPYPGLHVCVYDGQQCYRAKIIFLFHEQGKLKMSVLNIDNGKRYIVENSNIYHLDSDISNIPVQGLCCRLQGNLGDSSLWNDVLASLFSLILTNSNLVVTVIALLPGKLPQIVVDVDVHNDEREISKIELSKWITGTVFPKLCEVKQKLLPINRETLNTLFTYLDPWIDIEQATSNEYHLPPAEDFAINACALNSNFQQLSISSGTNDGYNERCTVASEQAITSELENSEFVLDWNLPKNDALPTHITPNIQKSLLSQTKMTVSMGMDFVSEEDTTYDDDDDDENATTYVVNRYKPKVEKRVCVHFASEGNCYSDSSCLKEHSLLNPDGWTTDKEGIFFKAFNKYPLPVAGSTFELEVTLIVDSNVFLAIVHEYLVGKAKRGQTETIDEVEGETLETLNAYMNQDTNVKKLRRLTVDPAVGQIVVALYKDRFYRARVIDYNEDDVQVIFVDYGNVEWVKMPDVRNIVSRYLHLPFQAIEFVIANVEALPGDNDIKGKELFHEMIKETGKVHAKVIARSYDESRMEVLISDDEGHDVGERLIQAGFCTERRFRKPVSRKI
ncbi:hypothetical protein C0J52_02501 [Blattella germanica]|nr:hypothetical protein C0J52_02501 [Blattella germanica]